MRFESPLRERTQQALGVCCGVLVWLGSLWQGIAETPRASVWLTPSALASAPAASRLYLLCPGGQEVRIFDEEMEPQGALPIPPHATGLALSGDEQTLYITTSDNLLRRGSVQVMDLSTGKVVQTWTAGYGATSPVLSHDGKTLVLCNRFDETLTAYDTQEAAILFNVPVPSEPVSVDISPDGSQIVVSHSRPSMASTDKTVACTLSILDGKSGKSIQNLTLPNGSMGLRQIRISPQGKYAVVAHLLGRYPLPTTQVDRGWINSNAISIIELESSQYLNTVLLDNVDAGAANPWAVCWTEKGDQLLITHAGTHELSLIQVKPLLAKLGALSESAARNVPNDFSFLQGLRQRIQLSGNGPRAVTVLGDQVYIAHYFSDSLERILLGGSSPKLQSITLSGSKALDKEPHSDKVHWGEALFNDARLCFQGWQSCASCHSHDARADGLNWDLLNDGIGTPKNTKSLLLAHETPPSMVTGIRANASVAVRSGLRYSLFSVRPDAEALALDEYLKSLRPLPSPRLNAEGKLSEEALEGKKLFESKEVGCSRCHQGKHFTDMQLYDVGTAGEYDREHTKFDTPTLVEVWRSAPYLHDGSARTIQEVLTTRNPENRHGNTEALSEKELRALETYVLSL